ncbi:MAG TPA: ABC transporter permease [Terracidiphilus sp.]|nr:ABC transporter permease [Terracidiphilus sp.]
MSVRSRVGTWWRAIFRGNELNRQVTEELEFHIESRARDLVNNGVPREEAVRRARAEMGSVAAARENSRAAWGTRMWDDLRADVRFGLRALKSSPGFTLVALGTLAMAIGANAIVFSVLNSLVLRSLNVPEGGRVYQVEVGKGKEPSQSYLDYLDIRDRNTAFEGTALYAIDKDGLDTNGTPEPGWEIQASGNYFDVLRVQPALGRFFHATDEHGFDAAPVMVLSYAYWQNHFGSDPAVVGRVVRVNKQAFTIVGVAPKGFVGIESFFSPDFWVPVVNLELLEGSKQLHERGSRGLWIIGRLKPGLTSAQAEADLQPVAAYLSKTYPKDDDGITFALGKPGLVGDLLGGPVKMFTAALMLLAGLILLAACANLGSLFAARASDRWREVALRLALGSTRTRILRQLLTEAVMVALGGAALGIAGAVTLLRLLSAWQPVPDIPINIPVYPDTRTYVVALGLALVSGLLFGLVPVRQVMKANPYQGIKTGAAGTGAMKRFTLRDVLLALQIAMCAVLVTASLVSVRGMVRSLHANFGFNPQNAMQVNTDLSMSGYKGDQIPVMQRKLMEAIQRIPGVTAVGFIDHVPLNIGWNDTFIYKDSTTDYKPTTRVADAMQFGASPGYFEAAQTAVLAGRSITWDDTKNKDFAAVVNQQFARVVFGSEQNAVGKWFKIWGGRRVQVVGICEDGKYKTLSEDPQPAIYLSVLQDPTDDTYFIVRSNRGPQDLAPALERTLYGLNTGLPFTFSTWDRELGTALFAARAASLALGVLGGLGAMLAVTGIFGLGAYAVSKRMRELGIRVALGAQPAQVLTAALKRVFVLLAIGSAAGLALGLAATKLLGFIVYQASPRDPLVLAGVVAAMALLGIMAAWIPAMRALRADPLILLRVE